ncbi:MAG TPA: PEGA domain-containing protein, partial [Polyangia bacterium]|nr:PEGA domain-containing protein [Polyangia bacterium]
MALLSFFGPTPAHAQDAEEFVKRGIELRRAAKDAEAFAEFKKAWALQKTSRIEAQMALAEQALGLWVDAEEHLLEALEHSENDPWTQKNRAALTGALTIIQGHIGTLDVWGSPAGAAVFVNEKPVGTLPLKRPLRISDDSVIVRVRAEGFREWTRTLRLDLGQLIRQHVELIPATTAAVLTPPPAAATAVPAAREEQTIPHAWRPPEESTSNASDATIPPSSSHPGLRPYAWGAGAGAVLGVGLGVVGSFVANSKRNEFNGLPECGTSMLTPPCQTIKSGHD